MMHRQDTIVRTMPGERFTPYGLAKKLGAIVLLESASFHKGRERYSLIVTQEALRISETANGIQMVVDGQRTGFPHPARDLLDAMRYFAGQHADPGADWPFPAGGVGFLSYEFSSRCDTIRFRVKPDPLDLPLGQFILAHVFIVFDHYTDQLQIIGLNYHEHEIDLNSAIEETVRRIDDLDFNYLQPDERHYPCEWVGDDNREQYCAMVESLREEIIRGNLLQAVPSHRIEARTAIPALEAYRRLRRINPSPYLFYLDFGDWQLFGASPEMHVRVRHGVVQIRPIAGTRRRGATHQEDLALERELLGDEKECAEHLMLVDLARNDIGRVCLPGTVRMEEYLLIERYARVMHIVSEASGRLEERCTGIDAIRATFPAGTVSGAPKIRAIETVDALEPVARRFYAGLVGYIGVGGDVDSCIAIRCAYKRGDRLITQAGGGIVYDSRPEREYEETREKLQALIEATTGREP